MRRLINRAAASLARRVVEPAARRVTTVLDVGDDYIVLPRSAETAAPGVYSLRSGPTFGTSRRVGELLQADSKRVTRAFDGLERPALHAGDRIQWTGHVFSSPTELGIPVTEVEIGPYPAWLFTPAGSDRHASLWVIHVHGIRTSRSAVLRGVSGAGAHPSLVVSFHGDEEHPGVAHLGQEEWRDVDHAIEYATDHGASGVILVGWSMGATISLILANRSSRRESIKGLVLVSPALDWNETIRQGVRKAGLPPWLARPMIDALVDDECAARIGLDRRLERELLAPELPSGVPVTVLHSRGDETAPFSSTLAWCNSHQAQAELIEFAPVPHSCEWNSEPDRFDQAVSQAVESAYTQL